jgi:hypothetical protein
MPVSSATSRYSGSDRISGARAVVTNAFFTAGGKCSWYRVVVVRSFRAAFRRALGLAFWLAVVAAWLAEAACFGLAARFGLAAGFGAASGPEATLAGRSGLAAEDPAADGPAWVIGR